MAPIMRIAPMRHSEQEGEQWSMFGAWQRAIDLQEGTMQMQIDKAHSLLRRATPHCCAALAGAEMRHRGGGDCLDEEKKPAFRR